MAASWLLRDAAVPSHTACCNILLRYLHPRVFDPLDLAIIDRVYDAAWAQLEAREPFRDKERDGERQDVLRKPIIDDTGTTTIEFDVAGGQAPVIARVHDVQTFVVHARRSTHSL